MAELKTKPTDISAETYIAAIADEAQRADCAALAKLMKKWTKHAPKMWGPSIVGYGEYHYTYESGHSGTMCATGFSARKGSISVYLTAYSTTTADLLAKLGKHKMGKSCLTIKKLSDVDMSVLEQLVVESVAEIKKRHP